MRKFLAHGICLLLVPTLALCLIACAKKVTVSEEAVRPATGAAEKAGVVAPVPQTAETVPPAPTPGIAETYVSKPIAEEAMPTVEAQKGKAIAVQEGRTSAGLLPIYYDFDKYNVRPDQISGLDHNAEWMRKHPAATIRIEGNCDEKGSNEYNLALGERRANSAKDYLTNLGISPDRLETLSYGEEKPLCFDLSEECWTKNRRADFVIVEK